MVEDLPLTYLHIFPYSPRPGTPAAALPGQVPVHVARQRHGVLRGLISGKKQDFARSFVGRTLPAITLLSTNSRSINSRSTNALTDNYLELRLPARHEPNRWVQAHITGSDDGTLT